MSTILDYLSKLFSTQSYPPRWQCGEWTPLEGWIYITGNIGTALAYISIPMCLLFYLRKKQQLPFQHILRWFIAFILFCGVGHFVDALVFWYPIYRANGLLLLATAVVSWATAWVLYKNMPYLLSLKTPEELRQVVTERTTQLKGSIHTLTITSERLAQQNRQLEDFTNIASHNLRAPIVNLNALASLYEKTNNPDEKEAIFTKFHTSSKQLLQTIDDLHEVLNIQRSCYKSMPWTAFHPVIEQVLTQLNGQIEQVNAKVCVDIRVEGLHYHKAYLESIIFNLLSNAIKYAHPKRAPQITLRVIEQNNVCILTCQDNGVGIDLKRYGDKLFKLHNTFHQHPEGRGVGLFITKNQVEALGGTIHVESQVGQGTCFIIALNQYPVQVNTIPKTTQEKCLFDS